MYGSFKRTGETCPGISIILVTFSLLFLFSSTIYSAIYESCADTSDHVFAPVVVVMNFALR